MSFMALLQGLEKGYDYKKVLKAFKKGAPKPPILSLLCQCRTCGSICLIPLPTGVVYIIWWPEAVAIGGRCCKLEWPARTRRLPMRLLK